jgi:hypothetical protein
MIQLAVKLGYAGLFDSRFHSCYVREFPRLGCKGSSVQIRPRRPTYPTEITQHLTLETLQNHEGISAHICSKLRVKAGNAGGKIGVLPESQSLKNFEGISRSRNGHISILSYFTFLKSPVSTSPKPGGSMARINLEDRFFLDVIDVAAKTQDQDKAIGNAVRWLRYSQEKHKSGQVMPEHEFFEKGFLEALIPNFAIRTATGIMAVGAEKHFKWLKDKVDAGRKGGRSKSEAKKKSLKQFRSKSEAKPKQIEALSKQESDENTEASPKQKVANVAAPNPLPLYTGGDAPNASDESLPSPVGYFVKGYCDRFMVKYGTYPEITGKESGVAKRVAKDWSYEKIDLHLDAFFALPDAWLNKIKHPIVSFETKLTEITVFAKTGNFTTQKQSQQGDAMATNLALLKKVQGGPK